MTDQALLLTPSSGRGGGIERYVETLQWALAEEGVKVQRIDLSRAGPSAHARMIAEARRHLRACVRPTRMILAHRCLLPVAVILERERWACGTSVLCHGSDVWGSLFSPRWYIEKRLMRRSAVRVVAVSSFTAGTLASDSMAAVLSPGLSRDWFDTLVQAATAKYTKKSGIQLLTAFRLADWRDKGLPQLLEAVATLKVEDIGITICGSGEAPVELARLVKSSKCCTLRAGLNDVELAGQLAEADLFVLGTRTRVGRHPAGEGFGLVLLEAQIAGTAVIGPAYGGSHDAYLQGITGFTPNDESPEALAEVLNELLRDPCRLAQIGRRASEWARECFAPEHYASRVTASLL